MKLKWPNKEPKVSNYSFIFKKLSENKLKTVNFFLNKKSFLLLIICILFFAAFVSGVVVQRHGFSNFIAKPIVLDSIGIIKRKAMSYFASPETLYVDLKFENHMQLMFTRDNAIEEGTIYGVDNEWVNTTVRNKDNSYKAKIRLKGGSADEHSEGKKWSFKLKLKNKETIFGMREFAVMSPVRRNHLGQWFIRKVYEKEGLITRKYEFINLVINGEDKGIYAIDERYDNIMLERNQRKEGPVMKIDTTPTFFDKVQTNLDYDNYYLSMDFTAFGLDGLLENDVSRNQYIVARNLMEQFRLGKLKANEVFDIDLLAKWTAIGDVMGAWHGFGFNNMRFYFNPVTSKFEPVPDDDYNERSLNYAAEIRQFRLTDQYNNSFFLRNLFSDHEFVEEYIRQLVRISSQDYLDNLFIQFDDQIKEMSNILAIDYPLYNFLLDSKQYTYDNAASLRQQLYFHKGIQAHLKQIKENEIVEIVIANNHAIPMEVLYVTNKNSEIYKPLAKDRLVINGRRFMRPVEHKTYQFEFPLRNNNITEELPKLTIYYRVIGTTKILSTDVFTYPEFNSNNIEIDIVRAPSNVDSFPFLEWDEVNNEIKFKKGDWQISSDFIVPPDHTLIIPQGVNIDLINSAMILSYSPVLIVGSEDNFIEISSSDNSGQGITLLNTKKDSLIKYVRFNGLSRPKKSGLELSGALNFYQSPIHFYQTHFLNNIIGDDYINIIRSDFTFSHSSISNSFSDAIDIDFSNGLINDSVFINCGFGNNNGDCIDLSGSIVDMKKINVNKAADKGISIGEESLVEINNSSISGSNIALAGKDFSKITVNNLTLRSSKTGISVFQKKPEFGPASVTINGLDIDGVAIPYVVEKKSFLSVDSNVVK